MYRYISRESCSQFDSLPLTSLNDRQLSFPPTSAAAACGGETSDCIRGVVDDAYFCSEPQMSLPQRAAAVPSSRTPRRGEEEKCDDAAQELDTKEESACDDDKAPPVAARERDAAPPWSARVAPPPVQLVGHHRTLIHSGWNVELVVPARPNSLFAAALLLRAAKDALVVIDIAWQRRLRLCADVEGWDVLCGLLRCARREKTRSLYRRIEVMITTRVAIFCRIAMRAWLIKVSFFSVPLHVTRILLTV
jgi:hypothetical protein